MQNAFRATMLEVVAALDALGISHYVGGSVASSHHGVPRSTIDVDVVAALDAGAVRAFCAQVRDSFYVDEQTALQCTLEGRSFNLIHFDTAVKIDIFPVAQDAFSQSALRRATRNADRVPIASAEDTILAKLRWYRLGGEASERQWSDVLGVFRVQRGTMDEAYMTRWGETLQVSDLVTRLRREA
jgi:hypothetical protein